MVSLPVERREQLRYAAGPKQRNPRRCAACHGVLPPTDGEVRLFGPVFLCVWPGPLRRGCGMGGFNRRANGVVYQVNCIVRRFFCAVLRSSRSTCPVAPGLVYLSSSRFRGWFPPPDRSRFMWALLLCLFFFFLLTYLRSIALKQTDRTEIVEDSGLNGFPCFEAVVGCRWSVTVWGGWHCILRGIPEPQNGGFDLGSSQKYTFKKNNFKWRRRLQRRRPSLTLLRTVSSTFFLCRERNRQPGSSAADMFSGETFFNVSPPPSRTLFNLWLDIATQLMILRLRRRCFWRSGRRTRRKKSESRRKTARWRGVNIAEHISAQKWRHPPAERLVV